jgi:hypothetical protein
MCHFPQGEEANSHRDGAQYKAEAKDKEDQRQAAYDKGPDG